MSEIRDPGEIAGYLLALKNRLGHNLDMDDLMQRIMRHDAELRAEVERLKREAGRWHDLYQALYEYHSESGESAYVRRSWLNEANTRAREAVDELERLRAEPPDYRGYDAIRNAALEEAAAVFDDAGLCKDGTRGAYGLVSWSDIAARIRALKKEEKCESPESRS